MGDVHHACQILNEAFQADPAAVKCLLSLRVLCNPALADHPSIPVDGPDRESATVGVLGLLNGIVGSADLAVAAQYTDECPAKLIGFTVVKPVWKE